MKSREQAKAFIVFILTLIISITFCTQAFAQMHGDENWIKYGDDWHYVNDDGSERIGWLYDYYREPVFKWYYFDDNGAMQTGWAEIDGKRYYFSSAGAMLTGWKLIDDKWYYFSPDGDAKIGWQYIDDECYFFNEDGKMLDGWQIIDGKQYYFDSYFNYGAMCTGWQHIERDGAYKEYYFNDDGVLQTGWTNIDGYWYYLDDKGAKHHNEWIDNCYLNMEGQYVENTEIVFNKEIVKFDIEFFQCIENEGIKTYTDKETIENLTEYCTTLKPTEKQLEFLCGGSAYGLTAYFEDGTTKTFSVSIDDECLFFDNAEYDIELDIFDELWEKETHITIWQRIRNFFADLFHMFD